MRTKTNELEALLPGKPILYRLNVNPEVDAQIVRNRKHGEYAQARPRFGGSEFES